MLSFDRVFRHDIKSSGLKVIAQRQNRYFQTIGPGSSRFLICFPSPIGNARRIGNDSGSPGIPVVDYKLS